MSEGKELKINVDSSKTLDAFKTEMDAKNEAQNQAKEFERQLIEERNKNAHLEEQLSKGGGAGTLSASLNPPENNSNVSSGQKEFDSFEEMIEWARVNDRKSYEALKNQSVKALMDNKGFFEWKDTFTKDAKGNDRSLIGRTLDKSNCQKRRQ